MNFTTADEHIKTVANRIGYYVGGVVASITFTAGFVNAGYWYLLPLSLWALAQFAVALFLYAGRAWALLSTISVTSTDTPEFEPQAAEPAPVVIHTPTPQNAPQRPNLPTAEPVREQPRQAEFAPLTDTVRLSDRALKMITGHQPFPYDEQWLYDLLGARLDGQLANGASDRSLGIATGLDRLTDAPTFKGWLIERGFLTQESSNSIHAWTPMGEIAFPATSKNNMPHPTG